MKLSEGAEESQVSVREASKAIVSYLQEGQAGAYNSKRGYRPNEDMIYDERYYDEKDKSEKYSTYEKIFKVSYWKAIRYPSLKAYLTEKCQEMMLFPEPAWRNVMAFIEEKFRISVEPPTGHSPGYTSCVTELAREFRQTEESIESLIPFEEFKRDSRAAIAKVFKHFGVE